jgi:hypothetical protein
VDFLEANVVVLLHGPEVLCSGYDLSSGAFKGLEVLVVVMEKFFHSPHCKNCFPLHLPHGGSSFSGVIWKVTGIVHSSNIGSMWGFRG